MDGSANLKPWQPGQSGNPEGSSQKARHQALLRAAFAELAGEPLPKALSDRLSLLTEEARGELIEQVEGITYAKALAARKWLEALFGAADESFKATGQILGTEPKLVELSGSVEVEPRSHRYLPTEADQQALKHEITGNGHDTSGTLQ